MAIGTSPPIGLLDDKVVVITGAGRGIGKVSAKLFAAEGAKLVVADISGDEEGTASEIGGGIVPFHLDVTREDQVEAMFAAALKAFGRVDASVHVAGPLGGRRSDEVTVAEWEEITRGHLLGMLLCSKHAIRAMVPGGGGAIVNFSSVASLNADLQPSLPYAAAKAGINSMTKTLAVQYGPQNIRVNAIAPGFTLSEKNRGAPGPIIAQMTGKAMLRRGGEPEEQAHVAAFLCSDRSSFVTGTIIPVDGGWSARLA